MPRNERTVSNILAELTRDYEIEPTSNTFYQRGILSDCDRLIISDYRVVCDIFQSLGISSFSTSNIKHLRIYNGTSGATHLCLTIDSINSNLIYVVVSVEPIPTSFEYDLETNLQSKSRVVKKLEF